MMIIKTPNIMENRTSHAAPGPAPKTMGKGPIRRKAPKLESL
jgi:hypothetical protein